MGARDFAVRCTALDHCAAIYAGGLHVMVWRAAGQKQLAAMAEVPQTFYNHTVGLLGLWSSNRSDDFLMSDGRIVLSADLNPPSEERLHNFALSCERSTTLSKLKCFNNRHLDFLSQSFAKYAPPPFQKQPVICAACGGPDRVLPVQGRFRPRRACCCLRLRRFRWNPSPPRTCWPP